MSKYINDVKDKNCDELFHYPGVVGVAVGPKETNNASTSLVSIKVYVRDKVSKDSVIQQYGIDGLVPRTVGNIRTDVIHAGDINAQAYTQKVRPLRSGYSVGHPAVTAGTMGGFYIDRDGDIVLLSNNHVIADVNLAKICDPCVQPGSFDNPPAGFRGWVRPVLALDYIGFLKAFVPMQGSGNVQDSAILRIHPDIISNSGIITRYPDDIGSSGLTPALNGMNVIKFGRTTERTTGVITALNGTFPVGFGPGLTITFSDCIVTTIMAAGGDSGSVLMRNEPGMPRMDVGLLFAGSSTITLHNRIIHPYSTYGLTRI